MLENLEKILTEEFGANDKKSKDSDNFADLDHRSKEESDFHDFLEDPGFLKQ